MHVLCFGNRMEQKNIKIESLSKSYTDTYGYTQHLFDDVSFEIEVGRVTTILAPAGSGKSTLLRIVARIEDEANQTEGNRIYIPTKPTSFPWLNVKENVSINLKDISETELKEAIEFVGLEDYEDHFANNNSIGFRFRISLAQAIVRFPEVILIDDPLKNLSMKRKLELFALLRKIASEKGISILYATSSTSDAIRVSDKIVLLSKLPAKVIGETSIKVSETERADAKTIFDISDYFKGKNISPFLSELF